MAITRDDLLAEKKAKYQKLRDELWTGDRRSRHFSPSIASELQILMMEINYLENYPTATPDEIAFMISDNDSE